MIYELAKKLREAGFPFKWDYSDTPSPELPIRMEDSIFPVPTLSELIEACGDVTVLLWGCRRHGYYASSQPCIQEFHDIESALGDAKGSTPEEAVANLWLKLNEK